LFGRVKVAAVSFGPGEREDILEELRYAAWRSQEREIALSGQE
jgi:uncharacterized protein (DUF433 family)